MPCIQSKMKPTNVKEQMWVEKLKENESYTAILFTKN